MIDTPSTTSSLSAQQDAEVERLHARRSVLKRLGNWTRAARFEVRSHGGVVVLDLRSPDIPDDVQVRADLSRCTLTLLVREDAAVDHWDLSWTGRGGVKDHQPLTPPARRSVRLVGHAENSTVSVRRGGIAVLTAICSREFFVDARRAHRTGGQPSVADPAHRHT
jgi:hypothetical protein